MDVPFTGGPRLRLAAHLAVLALVWWASTTATGIRPPGLSAEKARKLQDDFEEQRRVGEFRTSLRRLRRIMKSFPDRPEYLQAEAEILTQLGDMKGAAASWEAFMAVAPFPADACPHIGRAYTSLKLPAKALDAHRRCYESDPDQADLMFFYARALADSDQYDESEELLLKLRKKWPGYKDALVGLLLLHIDRHQYAEAEEMLPEVLRVCPEKTDALFAAYKLADRAGNREAAKDYLEHAIRVSPTYADLYRKLAELHEADRELAKALAAYKALLELEPKDAFARKRVRQLEAPR